MRRVVYRYYWGLLVGFVGFATLTIPLSAASFQQASVRLDRLKASTATTGTVCATPSSSGTDHDVQVTFPPGFSVNPSSAAWTVDVSGIPSGSIPWPGIATASAVSGQTVTFPSTDLTPGNEYCFRFNNSAALTTSASGENYNGSIATRTSAPVVIDTSTYAITIVPNDQVTVTASVLPSSTDIELSMSGNPDSTTNLNESSTIEVTVSYRSLSATNTPLTVQTGWTKGSVAGSGSQLDILNYVIGSATAADDGTIPVVDLANRTVTWNIASLAPSAGLHTVSFKVQVLSSIPTTSQITASLSATASVFNTQLHQSSLTYTIQSTVTPTPTEAPSSGGNAVGPSATPGPGPTAAPGQTTPLPSTSPAPLTIKSIDLDQISGSTATIRLQTNNAATYIVMYGTSPANLDKKITSLGTGTTVLVTFPDLDPSTTYYFRITVRDASGAAVTSDLFTMTTASRSVVFPIGQQAASLSWNQIGLTSATISTAIVPRSAPLTIRTSFPHPETIREATAFIKNRDVLGVSTLDSSAPVGETTLIEILPGIFSGEITMPADLGTYQITARIKDVYGGITTQTIPLTIIVTEPISVTDGRSGEAVENATISIKRFEDHLKAFTPLLKGFAINYHSDHDGRLALALPAGTYTADVDGAGYQSLTARFTIDAAHPHYPVFTMIPDTSFSAGISAVRRTIRDFAVYCQTSISDLSLSPRVQNLALMITGLVIVMLTMIMMSLRLHAGYFGLPLLCIASAAGLIGRAAGLHRPVFTIRVHDKDSGGPIIGARVFGLNKRYHIIFKGHTGLTGTHHVSHQLPEKSDTIRVIVYRRGFYAYPVDIDKAAIASGRLDVAMIKEPSTIHDIADFLRWMLDMAIVAVTDTTVIVLLVGALIVARNRGIAAGRPLLIASGLLFGFWIIFIKNVWQIETRKP